jgi:hypothetical protein
VRSVTEIMPRLRMSPRFCRRLGFGHGGAADSEHLAEELLGERERGGADAVLGGQQPPGGALLRAVVSLQTTFCAIWTIGSARTVVSYLVLKKADRSNQAADGRPG